MDADRKAELLEIARICRKVPEFGAESLMKPRRATGCSKFHLQIESNGLQCPFGRFDQYLQPYYEGRM